MDGTMERFVPDLDASSVAGRITSIVGARFENARKQGNAKEAARFDVALDTIYFAALLLTVVNGTGETRDRTGILDALDATQDVIGELRAWIQGELL